MDLTNYEIQLLKHMTHTFRQERERQLRRIRRNLAQINSEYEKLPDEYIKDNGILSPEQEMEELKKDKAEAVIINKKLTLMLK